MIGRIDGTEAYLSEDRLPAFTLTLNDLVDPSKMKGPRSTTVKFANTKEFRRVFSSQYMRVPSRPSAKLVIGNGDMAVFSATIVPSETDRNEGDAVALAGNAAWFEEAKRTKLKELNFGPSGAIDPTYQQNTWTDETTLDYYPLINYGGLDGRAASYNVVTQYLRPALRVSKVLEVFFRDIGYTCTARGTLAKHWPRFILPSVHDKNLADQTYLDSKSVQQELVVSAPYTQGDPVPTDTINVDPAGIATSGYMSITPLVGTRYRVTVDGNVTITKLSISAPTKLFIRVRDMTALASPTYKVIDFPTGNLVEVVQLKNLVLGEFDIVSGRTYELQMFCLGPNAGTTTLALDSIVANWDMVVAEYVEGIVLDLATTAPDMTVMDLINAVRGLQFVIPVPYGNEVRFWYEAEYFRTPNPGITCRDWRDRMDHTVAPVKGDPERPKRVEYRLKDDNGDGSLIDANRRNLEPGFGNYNDLIGGYGQVQNVTVAVAPTAMGIVLEGLRVPVMRDEKAAYQVDVFQRTPRLLYANGVAGGEWVLDGANLTEYPVCHFVGAAGAHPLAFANAISVGDESTDQSIVTYGTPRLRRMLSSRTLEASMMLRDHELQDFDHGMPTLVDDGSGPAWYYVQEVKAHRFGAGRSTRVVFLEIPGVNVVPASVVPTNGAIEYPEIIVNPPFVPPCTNAPRFPTPPVLVSYRVSSSSQASVEANTVDFPIGIRLAIACETGGFGEWYGWVGDVVQRVAPGTGTSGSAWQRLNLPNGSIVENADYASATQWDRYLITDFGGYSFCMTFYMFKLRYMDSGGNFQLEDIYNPCGTLQFPATNIPDAFPDACRVFIIQTNTTANPATGWVDVGIEYPQGYNFGSVTLPPGSLYARVKWVRGSNVQGYSDRTLIV